MSRNIETSWMFGLGSSSFILRNTNVYSLGSKLHSNTPPAAVNRGVTVNLCFPLIDNCCGAFQQSSAPNEHTFGFLRINEEDPTPNIRDISLFLPIDEFRV